MHSGEDMNKKIKETLKVIRQDILRRDCTQEIACIIPHEYQELLQYYVVRALYKKKRMRVKESELITKYFLSLESRHKVMFWSIFYSCNMTLSKTWYKHNKIVKEQTIKAVQQYITINKNTYNPVRGLLDIIP
jgi:hypothetical protein